MKKLCAIVISIILVVGVLSGCSEKKLADEFDKDTVISAASDILELINSKDYKSIVAAMREDLQDKITVEQIETACNDLISKLGEFKEIKNTAVVGAVDPDTGEDYAVVLLECSYESGSAVYTLSYDIDLKLVGFFIR